MRKVVMLSAAAILGIASIAVSQAEDVAVASATVADVAKVEEAVDNAPQNPTDETEAAADAPADAAAPAETAAAAPAAEAAPATAAPAPAAASNVGKSIYDTTCMACHSSGVAGAPKFGDKAAWAPFIAKGMDDMVKKATQGVGAMPPKGGSTASDADFKAAIQYMVDAVK